MKQKLVFFLFLCISDISSDESLNSHFSRRFSTLRRVHIVFEFEHTYTFTSLHSCIEAFFIAQFLGCAISYLLNSRYINRTLTARMCHTYKLRFSEQAEMENFTWNNRRKSDFQLLACQILISAQKSNERRNFQNLLHELFFHKSFWVILDRCGFGVKKYSMESSFSGLFFLSVVLFARFNRLFIFS